MATTQNGVIGIPDAKDKNRYTSCRYEITCNKSRSKKYGLNGGKIIRLTISVDGKVTASYDKGWITSRKMSLRSLRSVSCFTATTDCDETEDSREQPRRAVSRTERPRRSYFYALRR